MIQIQGVDTSLGLASANHNEALYRRLLAKFCQIEAAFAHRCRDMIAADRTHDLRRQAHDLHSTGAALGALEVAELAATLEAATTQGLMGKPLLDLVDAIDARLAPVLAAMAAALEAPALPQRFAQMQDLVFMARAESPARAGLWR